jgi:20S proteasome subunit alpha 5
LNPSQRN